MQEYKTIAKNYAKFVCESGHVLELFQLEKPLNYSSVVCDICGRKRLETEAEGFYHCPVCKWDSCNDCIEYSQNKKTSRRKRYLKKVKDFFKQN